MPDSEAWGRELAGAFEVLLGKPLDAFRAGPEYALYHWNDMLQYDILEDFLAGTADQDATAAAEADDHPFSPDEWTFDHGRSIWLFTEDALDAEGPFGETVGAALKAVSTAVDDSEYAVSGVDFARVLAEHRDAIDGIDGEELVGEVSLLLRIDTDGTLFDAMRAATWTTGGPETLVALDDDVKVAPEWAEKLLGVPDVRLRGHLGMLSLCAQDARSDGAYYLGPGDHSGDFASIARRPGHQPVAGWEFGEGQASSVIFQVG
ncbi:hypothetical protein GCM10022243_00920 [Saccharothrix violaceirubra]